MKKIKEGQENLLTKSQLCNYTDIIYVVIINYIIISKMFEWSYGIVSYHKGPPFLQEMT